MSNTPGSETQLSSVVTTVRHFLWNDDYIELLSHRLDLQKVNALVDIGSGLRELSGLFALYMKPGATVHGFATSAEAVANAQAQANANPFSVNFDFRTFDGHALPLADDTADLAICQHTLVNEADPARLLAEMVRVVRPGGYVVAFEPNRLVQALVWGAVAFGQDLEQRLRLARYQAYYERGKARLGQGDDSIGDQLPRLFLEAGLTQLEVRLSDKAAALIPPYDSEEKRLRASELTTWLESYRHNRDLLRRCFLAGGGTAEEFESFAEWEVAESERIREQIANETFVHPGGMLTYIVIGRKAPRA